MKTLRIDLTQAVAAMLAIAMLVSCAVPVTGPGPVSASALVSAAAKAMSGEGIADSVSKALSSQFSGNPDWQEALEALADGDGQTIAAKALDEGSEEYLEFCIAANEAESVDDILEAAEGLAPASELEKVRKQAEGFETKALRYYQENAKLIPPSQRDEFYSDLTNLAITATVLITAAIVYWAVPDVILWGKVTAAAAVAVTAAVAAAFILAVVEHYSADGDKNAYNTFMDWLETVATDVSATWAVTASVITLGASLGREPVVTSIVLVIFALFGVSDEAEEFLEKYKADWGSEEAETEE